MDSSSHRLIFPCISRLLYEHWLSIVPSRNHGREYRPCQVTLRDSRTLDRVYVHPSDPPLTRWLSVPQALPQMRVLDIRDVICIEESPSRLPPRIASEIYQAGESGMRYQVFTLFFRDGSSQPYVAGYVDFLPLPVGKSPGDVVGVLPHRGSRAPDLINCFASDPLYSWCFFGGVEEDA